MNDLDKLIKELEIERLREEVDALRRAAAPKTFRRKLFEGLIGGGALLSALSIATGVLNNRDTGAADTYIANCERADSALRDGFDSPLLTNAERLALKTRKLRISEKCDKDTQL
jgi:ferric-dicitrate binding protein FerR (iron transport regulator)